MAKCTFWFIWLKTYFSYVPFHIDECFFIERYMKTPKGFVRQKVNQKEVCRRDVFYKKPCECSTIILLNLTILHQKFGRKKKTSVSHVCVFIKN